MPKTYGKDGPLESNGPKMGMQISVVIRGNEVDIKWANEMHGSTNYKPYN